MSDDPPRAVPPTAAGEISLSTLVELLSDGVEVDGDPTALAPSDGRVVKDAVEDTVYLGDGSQWLDTAHDSGLDLPAVNGITLVSEAADLPDASGGVRTLADNTAYLFTTFVIDNAKLRLGDSSPLLAPHGSLGGYIHAAGGTCLEADGEPLFARDVYLSAPGGTLFDLAADATTEMLVESCAFSDAAGFGSIADLGTIDGYRVPSFKGVNFEDFDAGLTFTGTPDKVFVEGSPLRTVTASNVRIFEFDSAFETDIVDMSNNYVKSVQPDTEVVHVDPAATINEIFQYRGVTHDPTVTEDNILTGQAGVDTVGYRVSDSYPLSNSKAFIDYSLDSETVTNISTQASSRTDEAAYERVAGTTTELGSARFTHADNEATYDGKRNRVAELTAVLSLGTGTSDVIAAAWFADGSLVPGTATRAQMNQQGGGISKTLTAAGVDAEITTGDTFDVRVANLGSTTDLTIGELNAKLTT